MVSHDEEEYDEITSSLDANKKSIVLFKTSDEIMDINLLHKGFNIHSRPQNYLRRRTNIEEIVYHAVMADTVKSPYASFKMANQYLPKLSDFDVLSGMRTIKRLVEMLFNPNLRTSTIIHRVGESLLLDEFDIDSFILTSSSYGQWPWLQEFMHHHNIYLNATNFSRQMIAMSDLYIKFLYHTLGDSASITKFLPSSKQMHMLEFNVDKKQDAYQPNDGSSHQQSESNHLMTSSPSRLGDLADDENRSNRRSKLSYNPDEFLRMAQWRLDDLSFLVGSDLPIFGTKTHPCISLRLSPLHEPIKVLTGVDMWLENILNEVPEVAMCFHNEGIVMQEYEIFKTFDLPNIAGFHTEQILRIVRNLIMFLKRNATQEGHTYWLVKEAGFDVVKLYDLTVLCEKPKQASFDPESYENESINGVNPFILPVASLCYKLAEQRVRQRELHLRRQHARFSATNLHSKAKSFRSPATTTAAFEDEKEMNRYVNDLRSFLVDVFRLLRNCLNLVSKVEEADKEATSGNTDCRSQYTDLKTRAVLLLCQLYLSTPPEDIIACAAAVQKPMEPVREAVSVNVAEFVSFDGVRASGVASSPRLAADNNQGLGGKQHQLERSGLHRRVCLGDSILDAFRSPQTEHVTSLAVALFETVCSPISDRPTMTSMILADDPNTSGVPTSELDGVNSCQQCAVGMLPLVIAKSALTRASRLWARVFGGASVSLPSPHLITPPMILKLFESVRLAFISLFYFEHLAPGSGTCLFCGRLPEMRVGGPVPMELVPHLLMAARRLTVVAYHTLEETRCCKLEAVADKLSVFAVPDGESVMALRQLATICPPGHNRLLSQLRSISTFTMGAAVDEHFCSSGDCGLSSSTECAVVALLDTLETVMRCIKYLLPLLGVLSFKTPTKSATRSGSVAFTTEFSSNISNEEDTVSHTSLTFLKNFNSQVSVNRIPKFWPYTLNLYMAGLRRYYGLMTADNAMPGMTTRLESRISQAFDYLQDPVLINSRDHLDSTLRIILTTLNYQAVKLATVAAPHLILTKCNINEDKAGRSTVLRSRHQNFPEVMICLQMAIEALLPGLCLLADQSCSCVLNPQLLNNVVTDLLLSAMEYSAVGIQNFFLDKVEFLYLLDDIAELLKRIEKSLPFSLAGVLGAGVVSTPVCIGHRKAPIHQTLSAAVGSDNLSTGLLSGKTMQCLVAFQLLLVRITLLQFQYSFGKLVGSKPDIRRSLVTRTRAALAWLDKNLAPEVFSKYSISSPSICDNFTYPETFAEDALLYLTAVACLVSLQITNIGVLSESGVLQIVRDAVTGLPIVSALIRWLRSTASSSTDQVITVSRTTSDLISVMSQLDDLVHCIGMTLVAKLPSWSTAASSDSRKKRRGRKARPVDRNGRHVGADCDAIDSESLSHLFSQVCNIEEAKSLDLMCANVSARLTALKNFLVHSKYPL